MLATPSSERHFAMYEALKKGATVEELHEITHVKKYFIEQMKELVEEEQALTACKGSLPADAALIQAKKDGFSDKYLSILLGIPEADVRNKRIALGVEDLGGRTRKRHEGQRILLLNLQWNGQESHPRRKAEGHDPWRRPESNRTGYRV